MTTPITAFASSDRGQRRPNNEDAFLMDDGMQLYVVADGMGGANGGEVASQMAVRGLREALRRSKSASAPAFTENPKVHPLFARLPRAVRAANRAIWARGERDPELNGMGTTLTGVSFAAGFAFLVHVGDSRVYRIRGDEIEQLSHDHTYVNEMIRRGFLRPEDADVVAGKHMLTRAVGVEQDVEVDTWAVETKPGDLFVLCSDGLANEMSAHEIREAVFDGFLRGAPDRLIEGANRRGGRDNITAVVLRVNEEAVNDTDSIRRMTA